MALSAAFLSPAARFVELTPSDDYDLTVAVRGLYVSGAAAGDLTVIGINDVDPVTFVGVQPGTHLPILVRRVLATGTTVDSILGMTSRPIVYVTTSSANTVTTSSSNPVTVGA